MKHYATEQWIDFAREVIGSRDKTLMQKHLDDGCKPCAKELRMWRHVKETATRQPNAAPSEGAVDYAKAMLRARGFEVESKSPLPAACLLFDSMQMAPVAGVRSAAPTVRQLLFSQGNYRLDLRMEPQFDSDKVTIMGQILDSLNPERAFGKVPVSLRLAEKVIAASETNEFGEFQLDCSLAGRLQLHAMLPLGLELSVSLIESAGQKLTSGLRIVSSGAGQNDSRKRKNRTRKKV